MLKNQFGFSFRNFQPTALKIVFLSPAAQRGGAEAVLLGLLRLLCEVRPAWSLHVLAGEDGPLAAEIRELGVSCEILPFPKAVRSFGENQRPPSPQTEKVWQRKLSEFMRIVGWFGAGIGSVFYAWRLHRRLRQIRPNIVHSNGMKMHLFGAATKLPTASLVWHLHDYVGSRRVMKPLLRRLSSRCVLVIANSESVSADVRNVLSGGPAVQTVYNTVDPEVFTPAGPAADLDQLASIASSAPGTIRIGLVATFAFWKGHEVFLRAAAATYGAHRFYVIGGPVYATVGSQRTLEELRVLAGTLGIQDRVGFTGFVEDVPAAMRALDIVVHASTEPEPFGLVIVQAMACARAVIVSAAGGACELVEPDVDALLHPPGDVAALASAIQRLAEDAPARARLGTAGRANVERRFTRAELAKQLVPLYESLPSSTQGGRT